MKKVMFLVCIITALGSSVFAADNANKSAGNRKPPELTTEQRQKMAGLHEKMAVCLRSERPMSECRQDMMKGCKDAVGKDGCPMMGGHKGHGGHHRMMDEQNKDKE